MSDLYLIAHKVRGEPAFDIAIILDQLDEDADIIWIIPTSGHRAYPWWHTPLLELACENPDVNDQRDWPCIADAVPPMPPSLQDHCHFDLTRHESPLANLRLTPAQPPIVRRM